jgi:uncharacterized membrane protein
MTPVTWLHIAAGLIALATGATAIVARKGGSLHARFGTGFVAAMLVLGATAAVLEVLQGKPEAALGGVFTCYFVATAWSAARRRDGSTGRFEAAACAVVLLTSALLAWGALASTGPQTPVGRGPVVALAIACLAAGLLDLNAILRRRLPPAQRIARHLWRMCFGFFIATGSFFLASRT